MYTIVLSSLFRLKLGEILERFLDYHYSSASACLQFSWFSCFHVNPLCSLFVSCFLSFLGSHASYRSYCKGFHIYQTDISSIIKVLKIRILGRIKLYFMFRSIFGIIITISPRYRITVSLTTTMTVTAIFPMIET